MALLAKRRRYEVNRGGQAFLAAMLAVMGAAHLLIRRWLLLPEEPRLELADA